MKFKKMTAVIAAAAVAAAAFVLPACTDNPVSNEGGVHPSVEGLEDKFTDPADIIVDFSAGKTEGFYAAHGYSNGNMFNCTWSRDSAVISDGIMNMTLSKGNDGVYYGAEYRSTAYYGYGYYSVCMKAAKGSGLVSSFFTYTNRPVWDEIDIEFLGKDTTHVQFNYYVSGVGGHEYVYELGFDAAEGFHEYGFDWQKGSITWYVDGAPIYRATQNLPSNPQQIMMNMWNCIGHDDWTGPLDESALPATAQYKWIVFKSC